MVGLSALVALAQDQAATAQAQVASRAFGAAPLVPLVGVESPIISEQYVLMPGDKLLVTVGGGMTYSYESWVTYEGKLTVNIPVSEASAPAVVDAIRVSGLTLQDAEDTLAATLQRYFRRVDAKLTLVGLRSGIVFVTGEVQYPGAYNAAPVERVSQVVTKAGGLSPLGSQTRINLVRGGRLHAIADIERFENRGDLMANPFVESGDVIYVPAVEGLVTVKGAVFGRGPYRLRTSALTTEKEKVSEGIYELKAGERVFDMIRKAGGITPWADLANCYLERIVLGGNGLRQKVPIDLHSIIFERDSAHNIELANSDMLVVPPINTLICVEGEVTNPGSFNFTPNQPASHYIGQAGGPTTYAYMRGAYIIRNRQKISARPDPIVEPGDIVFVPRMGLKWWQDYVQILSAIGIPVATILVTVSLARQNR